MEDGFELPVTYAGKELLFPARLLVLGFTHKVEVDVFGQMVLFEPDEERCWRALIDVDAPLNQKATDRHLLQAIAETLEEVTK